jgi:hypothetical protein
LGSEEVQREIVVKYDYTKRNVQCAEKFECFGKLCSVCTSSTAEAYSPPEVDSWRREVTKREDKGGYFMS